MGKQREAKLQGREKSRRYSRPNRAFVIAQQQRENKELLRKLNGKER